MTFEPFEETWKSLLQARELGQRLVGSHPLHLYYGVDPAGKAIFVLVTEVKPQTPEFSSVVSVDRGERPDGKWTIVLTLQEGAFLVTFVSLCVELARRSSTGIDDVDALDIFFETLTQWKAMLTRNPRRLSKEALRGLVAELAFMTRVLVDELSSEAAVLAWQGPFGAPQDFALSTGELYEIKAVHAGSRAVSISSVEQLDPVDDRPLALVVFTVEDCSASTSGVTTLPSLLSDFRGKFATGSKGFDELAQRLDALAVDEIDEYYAETHFLISGARYYDVAPDFPRIRRSGVPVTVDKVEYRLRLAGIEPYVVSDASSVLWRPMGVV